MLPRDNDLWSRVTPGGSYASSSIYHHPQGCAAARCRSLAHARRGHERVRQEGRIPAAGTRFCRTADAGGSGVAVEQQPPEVLALIIADHVVVVRRPLRFTCVGSSTK